MKDQVLELIRFLLKTQADKIKDFATQQSEQRENKASERAKDAEQCAESADSLCEKEKWEAIAETWREMANTFREENETLKRCIEELTLEATIEAKDAVEGMNPAADFSGTQTLLMMGNKTHSLPLPSFSPPLLSSQTELSQDDNKKI